MQPITISILGDYFDCQIYDGILYLWTFDGTLKVINWDKLIKSQPQYGDDRVTMKYSFMSGNFMYQSNVRFVFQDKQYRDLMLRRLREAQNNVFTIDEAELEAYTIAEHDVLQGELSIDSQVYYNRLYVGVDSGVFSVDVDRLFDKKKAFVNLYPEKLCDHRIVSMVANDYPQMALSCADEGLFEMSLSDEGAFDEPIMINSGYSSFANYARGSVYNSSLYGDGALSEFTFVDNGRMSRKTRQWDDIVIGAADIFKGVYSHTLSWCADDKFFNLKDNGFDIARYNPFADDDSKFTTLKQYTFNIGNDKVIGAGSALFGNIIEFDDRLLVIGTRRNKSFTVNGPITRWRVYPRSKNYLNQLHVILNDRINIYSFADDYFRDQNDKRIGYRYIASRYNYSGRWSKYEDFPEFDDYDADQ